MKTFVPNGPVFPEELLQAHEEGRLVLFCGAGISYDTGLPTFSRLVELAMEGCGVTFDRKEKHDPLHRAVMDEKYDRALQMLGDRAPSMRTVVMDILDQPPKPDTNDVPLHSALLTIARTSAGQTQLVTSNFDDRFERADANLRWQAGPRLGTPRLDHWSGPTYLHGRIDRTHDSDGRDLVLTSGDFGRAYLRDAWAARYVVELFREFTVLFVGYSLNDPIVGYLVDALAADMGQNRQFRKAYALAEFNGSEMDEKRQTDAWQAKHVEPILFRKLRRKNPYRLLNGSLLEWARHHASGLGSRIDEALTLGAKPSPTKIVTQEARNLAWALSKSDGSVAHAFAKADPAPHISWLEPLSQVKVLHPASGRDFGLFDWPSPTDKGPHLAPLAGGRSSMLPLTSATWELGKWLSRHMRSRALVDWVIARNGRVHPDWEYFLEQKFPDLPNDGPWKPFWRLILDHATSPREARWYFSPMARREDQPPPGWSMALLEAASPYLSINKPFRWGRDASAPPEQLSDLARFELKLADDYFVQVALEALDKPAFQAEMLGVADQLTSRLAEGMELLQRGGSYIGGLSDRFSLINPEGRGVQGYTPLVWLCVRVFMLARGDQQDVAGALTRRWVNLWRVNRLFLFRRMALHALAYTPEILDREGLDFLLDSNQEALWAYDCEPELVRFLTERVPHFSSDTRDELIAAIVAGSPQREYRNLDADDIAAMRQGQIYRRLGKLRQAGLDVPLPADAKPEDMADAQPARLMRISREDESAAALLGLPPEETVEALLSQSGSFTASRQLAELARRNPDQALNCLPLLAEQCPPDWDGWGGLADLAKTEGADRYLESIAQFVQDHEAHIADTLLWALANLIRGWGDRAVGEEAFRPSFLLLWERLWWAALRHVEAPLEMEAVTKAINAPGGILAETITDLILALPKETGQAVQPCWGLTIEGEEEAHLHGRIIAASRLLWLHRMFAEATRQILLPRMMATHAEALGLWEGYFWGRHWDVPLMQELVPAFLSMAGRFQKQNCTEAWSQMFADILIEAPSLLGKEDIARVMRNARAEDLRAMAWYFFQRLSGAEAKAGELWTSAIRPIIGKTWPATIAQNTPEVASALVQMALHCGPQFGDAVEILVRRKLLRPLGQHDGLLHDLEQPDEGHPDFCTDFPDAVLGLLDQTTDVDIIPWDAQSLRTILDRLSNARPELTQTPAYRRLRLIVERHGQ
jgi:hypothetical protein